MFRYFWFLVSGSNTVVGSICGDSVDKVIMFEIGGVGFVTPLTILDNKAPDVSAGGDLIVEFLLATIPP